MLEALFVAWNKFIGVYSFVCLVAKLQCDSVSFFVSHLHVKLEMLESTIIAYIIV